MFIALQDPEDAIQICLHKRNVTNEKGHWGIPGGSADRGENLHKAALREAREEACGSCFTKNIVPRAVRNGQYKAISKSWIAVMVSDDEVAAFEPQTDTRHKGEVQHRYKNTTHGYVWVSLKDAIKAAAKNRPPTKIDSSLLCSWDKDFLRRHGENVLQWCLQQCSPQRALKRSASDAWKVYAGRNCYEPMCGGINVNLDDDNRHPKVMSIAKAREICEKNNFAGFTYRSKKSRVWFLQHITDPTKFSLDAKYDVHQVPVLHKKRRIEEMTD